MRFTHCQYGEREGEAKREKETQTDHRENSRLCVVFVSCMIV